MSELFQLFIDIIVNVSNLEIFVYCYCIILVVTVFAFIGRLL